MKVAPGALRIAFAPRERETVTAATSILLTGADAMTLSSVRGEVDLCGTLRQAGHA